jgi:hypothetical protein
MEQGKATIQVRICVDCLLYMAIGDSCIAYSNITSTYYAASYLSKFMLLGVKKSYAFIFFHVHAKLQFFILPD